MVYNAATAHRELKWAYRFLDMARLVSMWSKDPSTRMGAVLTRCDNTVIAVGYNGFPKQMEDKSEWLTNREEKYSRVVHCEINALLTARQNIHSSTLYTWPFASCDHCCVQMIQAGVIDFVFPKPSEDALTRWGTAFERSKKYIEECGCRWLEIDVENN